MTVWCFFYKLFIYKSLYSKLWLHSFEVYLFMLLRLQLPSTFSSSCQEHAWEWRVSGWNHLKASASQKTHNSDFKHKCSKDIKGISSEMKIRPWAFPKRKNSFKYDGSAPVEKEVYVGNLPGGKYFCIFYDMSSVRRWKHDAQKSKDSTWLCN